ncbi:MAG TPA: hypothetical protein VK157_06345 [Phycisphaerales bacterium]|nr:hypothetical protein [Phycisphaerales bacterium]
MFTRSLVTIISLALSASALAQSATTFTYQGELRDGATPANGAYDVRLRLFDSAAGTTQLGPTLCVDNVSVVDGRFVVNLDFGSQFSSPGRFLELQVRNGAAGDCSNVGGFVLLVPRQAVTSVPAATFSSTASLAANASLLNGQPATFYSSATNINAGTLADTRLSANVPRLNATSTVFTGAVNAASLAGDGVALTNLNAGNIAAGTLADARLSGNVPKLNVANVFSASNTFSSTATFGGIVNFNNATTFDNAVTMRGVGGLNVQEESGGTGQLRLQLSNGQPTVRVAGLGAASTAGLRFAMPGATTAMHITNAGDVGIGTATPEGPLHVRGGGSMGGIVVTPDVTDTQSQLVLCENTSASNGMLMRYNGVTNNMEFRGRAADVESVAHMTINRDSGALVVSPATATGDASVQLPQDSVNADEVLDEPGLDFASTVTDVVLTDNVTSTLESVALTAPGPGFVVVIAQPTFDFVSVFPGPTTVFVNITTSSTATALGGVGISVDSSVTEATGTVQQVFTVGAGTQTYYVRAQPQLNGVTATRCRVTAMYFPTRY